MPATEPAPIVEVRAVSKHFGNFEAVRDVSLDIRRGEFLTLLGPSGCGKTTLLRMLAGFETPDTGDIRIDGRSMRGVMPYDRPLSMVFQSLALFPHLSVARNIAFGLELRRQPRNAVRHAVDEALELVGLGGHGPRSVTELSGGQRQRIALARALVVRPAVLLLDEPLSALDMALRKQLQVELKNIQRQVGTTFVFVTHDQDEALTMSDRIAVVNKGRIEQIAPAEQVYHHPATPFVARFVGETNLVPGVVENRSEGASAISLNGLAERIALPSGTDWPAGRPVGFCIRPENVVLGEAALSLPFHASGTVVERTYAGPTVRYGIACAGLAPILARVASRKHGEVAFDVGQPVQFGWDPADGTVIDTSDIAAPQS